MSATWACSELRSCSESESKQSSSLGKGESRSESSELVSWSESNSCESVGDAMTESDSCCKQNRPQMLTKVFRVLLTRGFLVGCIIGFRSCRLGTLSDMLKGISRQGFVINLSVVTESNVLKS